MSQGPQLRLYLAALAVGVMAGIGAVALSLGSTALTALLLDRVAGFRPPAPAGEHADWLPPSRQPLVPVALIVLPALGGLACGLVTRWLVPPSHHHGTDEILHAYHRHHGRLGGFGPLIRAASSLLVVGTGGSTGLEGPAAETGAVGGAVVARLGQWRAAHRRMLLLAGLGAGIAAVFRVPLAGAMFAAEVVYRTADLDAELMPPAGLACVAAYVTAAPILGWEPMFAFTGPEPTGPNI